MCVGLSTYLVLVESNDVARYPYMTLNTLTYSAGLYKDGWCTIYNTLAFIATPLFPLDSLTASVVTWLFGVL